MQLFTAVSRIYDSHSDMHKLALRVSGWSEGVEQRPIGFPGVAEGSDSVVGEVGEPERGAFDALNAAR